MPYAELKGINIHYEVRGSGPPLLMMAPGGFDSTIEKWTTSGIWAGVKPLETLTNRYTCVAYDRREAGLSGGKVERVSWTTYDPRGKSPSRPLEHSTGIYSRRMHGYGVSSPTAAPPPPPSPPPTLGSIDHQDPQAAGLRSGGTDHPLGAPPHFASPPALALGNPHWGCCCIGRWVESNGGRTDWSGSSST